jgi:hypothetical protein
MLLILGLFGFALPSFCLFLYLTRSIVAAKVLGALGASAFIWLNRQFTQLRETKVKELK